MNKNPKLFNSSTYMIVCTAIVFVVFFQVLTSVHYNRSVSSSDEKLEFVDNPEGFVTRDTLPNGSIVTSSKAVSFEVYVTPKYKQDRKEFISTSFDQTYRVDLQKVKLTMPASNFSWSNFPIIFAIASTIVTLIVSIWIIFMVAKLIISIHKGDIFVTKVAKYLKITGILIAAIYIYQTIASWILYNFCMKNIHMADYNIEFYNDTNLMYIVMGPALIVISQIILMGKDLKDEQELTI